MAKAPRTKQWYGIAEWYGRRFADLSDADRKTLAAAKNTDIICPFFAQIPALGPKSRKLTCNKKGGVCSLRRFIGPITPGDEVTFGLITATCPNRFLERGLVIEHIGRELLGADQPLFAKELPFLKRPKSAVASEAIAETEDDEQGEDAEEAVIDPGKENVGRIDLVLVNPDDRAIWSAVEMQAVYFSGKGMAADITAIKSHAGDRIPMPAETRRPDFRSSGPKRLMPQLMIKVPTLRRWGKKMVVVIDRPFFEAMDAMVAVEHVSNCDIVWVVVDYDEQTVTGEVSLKIHMTLFTTLEDAVKGLTSGTPTTLPEFEGNLRTKLAKAFR